MRNQFAGQKFVDEIILKEDGSRVGLIRIKPSSVLWKARGDQKFYCVPLDKFTNWITSPLTGARRTSW